MITSIGVFNVLNPKVSTIKAGQGDKKLNIVAVSDIHYGSTGTNIDLEKMVNEINALNPDVVFLLGDIIDNSGIFSGLLLIAIISLDLAIVNFLPIPALDGGHVLFLLIEKLRGRPLEEEIVDKIGNAGFLFLILLMVFVVFNDIFALITKQI